MEKTIEFLQMEKVEVKEKIKEYLDKDFKTNKLNERLDYLDILINKASNQDLEKDLEDIRNSDF